MLLLAFASTQCAVGPDYKVPATKLPAAWSEAPSQGVTIAKFDIVRWWETFNDPLLNSLIDRAVRSNHDVRIAEARLREARASRDVTAAGLWPSINSSGTYTRSHDSSNTLKNESDTNAQTQGQAQSGTSASATIRTPAHKDLFQAGFDAAWELDIFGGVRRSVEAADASIGAAQESHRDVIVSLLAEVALNYAELCGVQRQISITQNNLRSQQDTLDLTKDRYTVGLTNEIDVLRSQALVSSTQSQIPTLESQAKRSIHRLGILLGNDPGALISELSQDHPLPQVPTEVPVELPSDLLRRRPDIRTAERQLAAATAGIGVAVADMFPKFSLTGSLGRQAEDSSLLSHGTSKFWNFGPTIQWPVFEGGRIRANIKVQNARQEQALALYEKTILIALEDVENSLVDYAQEQIRRSSLASAVESNLSSVTLSRELYTQGLTDFLNVLDAERSLYVSQNQLVVSEQTVVTNLIALYKALGGGWEVFSQTE